ncbi:hypothetical protein HCH_06173 [Hahella chejuensis KCTC 2396]|uniref:Membrane-bound metal-dependent hydrolase n=1 Tax=Hahella chejuensis (strain KCTC 2396) TaxID=349521 RepID=Q2S956_HAHCH|nr:metal-dependent hydrolase [Hahella chejuensis]ABC32818.1 hypothetical protein HCH_06173 [Hahella chejuensis KCTC 2396]
MATTVAHALCGIDCLLAAHALRGGAVMPKAAALAFFALLGNAPDLDMLVGYFISGDHLAYHSRASHAPATLLVLAALLAWPHWRFLALWPGYFQRFAVIVCALLSHTLLDFLTGPQRGLHSSFGAPLLWPLSDVRVSAPFSLLIGPHHDTLDRFIGWRNVWAVASELLLFAPLTWLLWRQARGARNTIEGFK